MIERYFITRMFEFSLRENIIVKTCLSEFDGCFWPIFEAARSNSSSMNTLLEGILLLPSLSFIITRRLSTAANLILSLSPFPKKLCMYCMYY